MAGAVVEYLRHEILPVTMAAWHRLDVPSWKVYKPALEEFLLDTWKAGQSTAQLSYLTLRPVAMLCLIVVEAAWAVAQVFLRVLLSQGLVQARKGLLQIRVAAIWLYRFQMNLSRTELLGEAGLVVMSIALYYSYKWIKRQTYWRRFMKWYSLKKQQTIESITKFVENLARISLILAMALPHSAFIGAYAGFKLLFPSFVKWLAHDTYTTALISIWYPLMVTLAWVHEMRSPSRPSASPAALTALSTTKSCRANSSSLERSRSSTSRNHRQTSDMSSTTAQVSKNKSGCASRRRVSSVFSRTNPPKPETPGSLKQSPKNRHSADINFSYDAKSATSYWLRYWVVFALVQSLGAFGTMVPVFGSFVGRHPYVLYLCSELKLLFFVWLFTMENVIGAAVVEEDSLMCQTMPLSLIHEYIAPLLLEFEAVVAEAVSKDTWMSLVHSKVQRILEVFAMLKMLSESQKDWLLHILEESRTLLLPSLSLFMPSFITSFGVAYVQFVVPSAKSTRTLKAEKQSNFSFEEQKDMELLYLQYWIIHCLVSGFLAYFSSFLWWIPFSTHATFLLWCHLTLPKSIAQSYAILESEFVAFGLLPGDSNLELHETRTARLFQAFYSRLPSAVEEIDNGEEASRKADTGSSESHKPSDDLAREQLRRAVSVDLRNRNMDEPIHEVTRDTSSSDIIARESSDTETCGDENVPPSKAIRGRTLDPSRNCLYSPRKPSGSSVVTDTIQDCGSDDDSTAAQVAPTRKGLNSSALRRSTRQRRKARY